jgi:hypothetical protein
MFNEEMLEIDQELFMYLKKDLDHYFYDYDDADYEYRTIGGVML